MGVSPAAAQNVGAFGGETPSYVNEFYRPGRPTMLIYVLGQVGQPGMWRVEENVDLIDLLAAAGLPALGQEGAAGARARYVLHIYRGPREQREAVYSEPIGRILAEGSSYPPLEPGDILIMEQDVSRRVTVGQIFEYVRTVTSLISLYLLVRSLTSD